LLSFWKTFLVVLVQQCDESGVRIREYGGERGHSSKGVSEQFLSVLLSFLEILSHTLGGRIIFSIFDELYGVSVIAFDRRMRIIYLLKVLHGLFGEYLRICKLSLRLTEQHLGNILHN
jgi:hypothetical protein